MFVGFLWFSVVGVLTLWNLPPGKIARWVVVFDPAPFSNGSSRSSEDAPELDPAPPPALAASFTHVNTLSLLLCAACTVVTAAVVQQVLGKPFYVLVNVGVCAVAFAGQVVGAFDAFAVNGVGPALWCILFGTLLRVAFNRELRGIPSMSFAIMVSIVLLAINLKPRQRFWIRTSCQNYIFTGVLGPIYFNCVIRN